MSFSRKRVSGLAAAIALALALFLSLFVNPSASEAKPWKVMKAPAGLAFYTPPKQLPPQHGKLIWSRKANSTVTLTSGAWTRNVLYTSKSLTGKRIGVSGSVTVPKGQPPTGGWPVITYAHGTVGIADVCAPSRNTPNGPANAYITYTNDQLNEWLEAGYAVLRTDYPGLGTPGIHPYLIGRSEGRGVLDIVRAARVLSPKIGNRFLIAGHSQGGHAALFAGGQAAAWTPELNLQGVVAYAPASQLEQQAQLLQLLDQPSPASGLAGLIVRGASTASTAIDTDTLLSDTALPYFPNTLSQCIGELIQPDNLGGLAPASLLREGADLTPFYTVLGQNNPALKTGPPIFLAQGTADTTVFPQFTTELDQQMTAMGNLVQYVEYPGVIHGLIVAAAENDVLPWMQARLPAGG